MIKKLIGNSITNVLVPVVKMGLTLIMAPLIVRALGDYDYGVWEIVFAVVGYMGILDLGLSPAIVRYVARYHAVHDREALDKVFSTSLAFFVPVGSILCLGLLGWAFFAPQLFGGPTGGEKYVAFLVIIALQVLITFPGTLFDCYLEGFQLYTLRNLATIAFSIGGAVTLFFLLKAGGGLLSVAAVNATGFSLKLISFGLLLALPRYGGFRFRFRDVSPGALKELFGFGVKSFAYAVSLRISSLSNALVIGAFLGPAAVTYFVIPANLIGHVRTLVWAMTRGFMPVFSELDALADGERTARFLFTSSRFALGLILPVMIGTCILGPTFLALWMGPQYAEGGRWIIYLLSAAYLVQWLNPFSNRFLTGAGRHGVLAKAGMIAALTSLGLSLIFVKTLGKEGVALATLIPFLILEPFILVQTCHIAGRRVQEYVSQVFAPLLVPNLAFFVVLRGITLWVTVDGYARLLFAGGASIMFYVLLFIAFAVSKEEKGRILCKIKGMVTEPA